MKKKIFSTILFLLVAILLFQMTACKANIQAEDISKNFKRNVSKEVSIEENFTDAFSNFTIELFKKAISKDDSNDLVSPLSAILCLGMLANGTDGNSRKQLEDLFGMSIDKLNQSLYAFTQSLYSSEKCKLNIADSIWYKDTNEAIHINEDFLQQNANWYQAQIYKTQFDDRTLKDINNWVKENTDGMIEKILDQIPSGVIMYLINAMSFDAKWQNEYEEKDISKWNFHNYNNTNTQVDMLSSTEHSYLQGKNVVGFRKNYIDNRYSFVALLPNEGVDIYTYIQSLNGSTWQEIWNSQKSKPVQAKIPEFSYDCSISLTEILESMGVTDIFNSNADFSKLSDNSNLCCSGVYQKTFIELSRNGTKAAAVTWADIKNTAFVPEEPIYIILDRPFVYAIVDNTSGLPLFIGTVSNL